MTRYSNRQNEISYEIIKHLGVIDKSETGWSKEVNLVEWNGKPAKIDIREWDPRHEHMSRGITLHKKEMLELLRILIRWYGRELGEKGFEKHASAKNTEEKKDKSFFVDEISTDEAIEEIEPIDAFESSLSEET